MLMPPCRPMLTLRASQAMLPAKETAMCYSRSYALEEKAKAEAERQKQLAAKRDEVVGSLLRDPKVDEKQPQATPRKEVAPAK